MNIPEKLTVKWLKDNYKSGAITPEEVVTQIIERVSGSQNYNIWIQMPKMDSIRQYISQLGKSDYNAKPLWGVPFAVKDNIDLQGYATTAGCPDYSYMPEESSTVVARLISAGAIPLGKTNLDQFATGLVGTRSPYGEVHNSVHEELISGGSSAGSAVSVALGEVAFALGTDTAGSGRIPASLNNLIGFKPTVGAWPSKGVVPACASLDCVTVFANNVEDAQLVDSVVRGLDETDMWSKEVIRKEDSLPEKIIIPQTSIDFYGVYADRYEKAWYSSIEVLMSTGITVETADTEFYQEAAGLLYGGPCVAERWSDLGEFVTEHSDSVFPVTRTILKSGNRPDYTAEGLYKTLHQLKKFKLMSDNLLKNAVLVFPTCAGTYSRDEVRANPIDTNSDMGRYTNHCNLLDMCAIAVPTAIMEDDMPFGITVFSTAGNEHLIMGLSQMLAR